MSTPSTLEPEAAEPFDLHSAAAALPGNQRFSDGEVEGLYAVGREHFMRGHHDKALNFLMLAAMYRPCEAKYFLALGICQKMLKSHDAAIESLFFATSLDPANLAPGLHVVDCLLATGRSAEAVEVLHSIEECASGDDTQKHVHQRATALLELLLCEP